MSNTEAQPKNAKTEATLQKDADFLLVVLILELALMPLALFLGFHLISEGQGVDRYLGFAFMCLYELMVTTAWLLRKDVSSELSDHRLARLIRSGETTDTH